MKKLFFVTSFLFTSNILLSCVCGGGRPYTNIPTPPTADTFPKINVQRNQPLYAYGDSFTAGYNASPLDSSYIRRLATYLNATLTNRAISGSYANSAWTKLKEDKINGINENVTILTGVNDYRLATSGHTILTMSYIGYLKSAITLQFLKTHIPATSPLITKMGTWDSSSTDILGSFYSKYLFSSTNNSTLSYTFTDSTLVIGTYGSNGSVQSGHFDISIDGVFKGRYTFGGYSTGGYTPQTLIFRGLSNTSHTVVITKVGTLKTCFDYIGHLKDISNCKPILIGEFPNWNKSDYGSYLGTNTFQYVNNQVCTILEDFYKYPTAIAPINMLLNPETDIDLDLVHPTNNGHRHIFDAFKLIIN